jgi:hypothetical protein
VVIIDQDLGQDLFAADVRGGIHVDGLSRFAVDEVAEIGL